MTRWVSCESHLLRAGRLPRESIGDATRTAHEARRVALDPSRIGRAPTPSRARRPRFFRFARALAPSLGGVALVALIGNQGEENSMNIAFRSAFASIVHSAGWVSA